MLKKEGLAGVWKEAHAHVEANLVPAYKKIRDKKQKEKIDNLMSLIDNYAESRHVCGNYLYNAKTQEARNAVLVALKGE